MNKSYIRILYNKEPITTKLKKPHKWIYDVDFNELIEILKKYKSLYKILIK